MKYSKYTQHNTSQHYGVICGHEQSVVTFWAFSHEQINYYLNLDLKTHKNDASVNRTKLTINPFVVVKSMYIVLTCVSYRIPLWFELKKKPNPIKIITKWMPLTWLGWQSTVPSVLRMCESTTRKIPINTNIGHQYLLRNRTAM